jgi:hypothetical protein
MPDLICQTTLTSLSSMCNRHSPFLDGDAPVEASVMHERKEIDIRSRSAERRHLSHRDSPASSTHVQDLISGARIVGCTSVRFWTRLCEHSGSQPRVRGVVQGVFVDAYCTTVTTCRLQGKLPRKYRYYRRLVTLSKVRIDRGGGKAQCFRMTNHD